MRAGAAARVRERMPRPKRSRVSKINDLVWRPVPAVQVCLHVCYESDNRGQAPPTQKVIMRVENYLQPSKVLEVHQHLGHVAKSRTNVRFF